ncbi:MAG: MmcQ/YjbR family DNA-binding protein [Clostridiales bacterium]|nr:MmcQ/YjbR family DNA-binding protein [Clostridiales bacterium]
MATVETSTTPWPADEMKKYLWLDEYLRQQPATEKVFQPTWQADKYMLRQKMYAYIGMQDKENRPIITLKLDPLYSDALRQAYPDIVPGYYMNKVHWSTVYLDGAVPRAILEEMVRAAHKTVFATLPKKIQAELS